METDIIANLILKLYNKFVIIIRGKRMYEIIFYEDRDGKSEVADYIRDLRMKAEKNKHSRINFEKIVAYFDLLEEMGTRIGEPVTKHLDGEIWELRPFRNRILYAYYKDNKFVILHHFIKKTQKTPSREIQKAKNNLRDFLERNE